MKRTLVSLACLLLSATAGTAQAAPIVYTTEAGWLAALGAATVSTENFASSPLGNLAAGTTDIGLFNITINKAGSFTTIVDGGSVNGSREYQGRLCDGDPGCDDATAMSLDFDSPLVGFAGNWASTTSRDLLTMLINGTTIKFSDYLTVPGTGILGVVDSAGFSAITFGLEDNPGSFAEVFQLDNARLASGSAIPEPATLGLLGLGLAGLGFARRRKA